MSDKVTYSKTNRRGKTKEISEKEFYNKRLGKYQGRTKMTESGNTTSFTTKKKDKPKSKSITSTFTKARKGGTVKK